jgi:eukaryotic-like serine/threonine-protein kinase
MSLSPGTRLGAYTVVAPLGAGGMGEVYRATDTKLGREVALKLLPEAFASDAERIARFEREARLLASVNHTAIAHLYGFEKATLDGGGAVHFIAMELVEGEDLAERLKRGKVPVDEAIAIARQVAEALEEAHEKGIVHRDLKPGNVKVTPEGKVKVLDFGLAKAWTDEGAGPTSSADLSRSPTLAHTGTAAGIILGTAAYMSPEQARGKAVDRRADIWAFGVVLYEMLTGHRLFGGETLTDVLAAVVRQEIGWHALPQGTPASVRRLLARCLDRDPRLRLRDIGEARVALGGPDPAEPPDARSVMPGTRVFLRGLWLALGAGVLLAGLALGSLLPWPGRSRPAPPRLGRTLVLPAPGRTLDDSQAISPDGRWVAYTASGVLWIRDLGETQAREVKDSRGARRPFWSPRSDAVAFATDAALLKVSLQGDRPVELCRFSSGEFTGGAWSAEKGIVFTTCRANWNGDVLRVPEAGGEPEVFTRADPKKRERRLADPHFLPDGRNLLFTAITLDANDGEIALDRHGVRTLLGLGDGSSRPTYSASGHVVFTRSTGLERALWAEPFSLSKLAAAGGAFRIAANASDASVAADGTLVYVRRQPDPQQLVWVDRGGRPLGTIGEPRRTTLFVPAVSPDGRRVAANVDRKQISVWDTERGTETRVTAESERTIHGEWLPGGQEIAYPLLGVSGGLAVRRADGSGEARLLIQGLRVSLPSFSPDGSLVAFYVVDPETARDLWTSATSGRPEPSVLLRTPANEAIPRISPDGKFLAYQTDASGRWEVYVQPFPRGEGRYQVSVGGGQQPLWNPGGGELFYVSGNDLMVVDVTTKPTFRASTPRRLFGGEAVGTRLSLPTMVDRFYGVAPDGRRFVVVKGNGTGTSEIVLADGALARAGGGGERPATEKGE